MTAWPVAGREGTDGWAWARLPTVTACRFADRLALYAPASLRVRRDPVHPLQSGYPDMRQRWQHHS